MSQQTTAPAPTGGGLSRAWYTVIILMVLYSLSFMDRLILSLLASDIGKSFAVTDTQIGLLFGGGFGIVYALTGLPLAHLVDKHHRVRLVTIGVVLWSICTIASGFAPNYGWLVVLRAGVAIGEAVLSPAAISIIADTFPRDKRTMPTTAYTAVSTFMGMGSFVIGGAAFQLATQVSGNMGLEPWQLTLVFVGLPSLILAPVFLFTVREPTRAAHAPAEGFDTAKQAIAYVGREKLLYGGMFAAAGLMAMINFANSAWSPTLLIRGHGVSPAVAGYLYGTVGLVGGVIGAIFWPAWVKSRTTSGRKDALVTTFAFALTFNWLAIATIGLTRSEPVMLVAAGLANFFTTAGAVLIPLTIQLVTPGRMRGRIMAGYLMANNIIGMTLGPALAAMFGERFFHGVFAIGSGLAVVACICGPLAGIAVLSVRKAFVRAYDEAELREGGAAAAAP